MRTPSLINISHRTNHTNKRHRLSGRWVRHHGKIFLLGVDDLDQTQIGSSWNSFESEHSFAYDTLDALGTELEEPQQAEPGPVGPTELAPVAPDGEFDFEWETSPKFESVASACKPEPGEVVGSHTSAGILSKAVENTSKGILVADFGVDWRTVKDTAKRELAPWIHRLETDPTIIEIRISGYSDCIGPGDVRYQTQLRRERALRVLNLLGPVARKKVKFVGAAPLGAFFAPNTDRAGRARNRSVLIEYRREITFEPRPVPPPRPAPQRSPSVLPPPIFPKPKPVPTDLPLRPPVPPSLPPWLPPRVTTSLPTSDPSGPSWVWGAIGSAANLLGMTVSMGLRSLTAVELGEIIEAAWLVLQTEGGPLKTVVGLAGEAAARKAMSRVLGVAVYDLNELRPGVSFPVLDIISSRGLSSVKVRGLLGARTGAARAPSLAPEYIQDLVDIAVGGPAENKKLAKAASLLFDNRAMFKARGVWPMGFNPRSVAEVELYIRDQTKLYVPDDHVQLVKEAIGEALYKRVKNGNIWLPRDTDPIAWTNLFVDRVDSIGLKSSELDALIEAARKCITKEQIPRLHRDLDKLRRLRRRT
jgi:outer membrane protein OmpA-like peptidoglycan-associated protein